MERRHTSKRRSALAWGLQASAAFLTLTLTAAVNAQGGAMPKINDIVLVHGGFVDGAGWRGVYDVLKKDGFNVSPVRKSASAPLSWQALKALTSTVREGDTD
jgi:hypothetical protein